MHKVTTTTCIADPTSANIQRITDGLIKSNGYIIPHPSKETISQKVASRLEAGLGYFILMDQKEKDCGIATWRLKKEYPSAVKIKIDLVSGYRTIENWRTVLDLLLEDIASFFKKEERKVSSILAIIPNYRHLKDVRKEVDLLIVMAEFHFNFVDVHESLHYFFFEKRC